MTHVSSSLQGLNKEQLELAKHIEGPCIGVAGPGSGKTHTVVSRAAYMIESGIDPANMLMFSFTKKAAGEMKERITRRIPQAAGITVGTYHSFCSRVLRQYATNVGYQPNFTIYDTEDSKKLLKTITQDPFYKPEMILSKISGWKSKMIDPNQAEQLADNTFDRILAGFYRDYQKGLKEQNAVDFDDLISLTIELLQNNPSVKQAINDRYQYIFADEFQDSSKKDIELIRLLAGERMNICMIMDDCQCLLPGSMIQTKDGLVPIEEIHENTKLIIASGHGDTSTSLPQHIRSRHHEGVIYKVTTANGNVIKGTPNHIVFARQEPKGDIHYVYLMFKENMGYRIGRTSGVRTGSRGALRNGYECRLVQEKSDKLWVLKTTTTLEEAIYWESYYAYKYSIPQYVFHNRGTGLSDEMIKKLYAALNTEDSAKQLLEELNMYVDMPHCTPAGATRSYTERMVVNFNMFGNKEKNKTLDMSKHSLYLNTQNKQFADICQPLVSGGWYGKEAKYFSTSAVQTDYDNLHRKADAILAAIPEAEIKHKAKITDNSFDFTPLSHVHEHMTVGIYQDGKIIEDTVVKVEQEEYFGKVYDLDVEYFRNYIADGVVVHNSIYGFRGADIDAVLDLAKIFPDMKTYLLQENYRSTSTIVRGSMNLISHNKDQIEKEIFTNNKEGEDIVMMECSNQKEEASKIVNIIKGMKKTQEYDYKDIAILYRLSFVSRNIEDALLSAGIPYTIVGGVPFYARKEVKDIMAYIRLIYNGRDRQAFERIINLPKRSLGPKTVEKIIDMSQESIHSHKSLPEVCKGIDLKGKAKAGLDNFNAIIDVLTEKSEQGIRPQELVALVKQTIGYEAYLLENDPDAEDRLENLVELETIASQYDSIEDFIYNMSLNATEEDQPKEDNKVQLLTMHASKGLEFPVVIIASANEGVAPHFRAETQKQIDEERRLFYVAVSRAEELLFITRPRVTMNRGQMMYASESRFIKEIGEELLLRI